MIIWNNPTSQFHQIKPNWTKSPIRVFSSPRNSKFSQFNKLIKLNYKDHVYSIPQQKLINKFWKKRLKTSKTPNLHWSKNYPNNAWKLKINEKGRVIWSYQPWERKTLQKDRRKTTKKLVGCLDRSNRERKSVWNFWKVFKHVKKQGFLKTLYTTFDWSKYRFDRSKMLRLININRAPIERDRGWPKF